MPPVIGAFQPISFVGADNLNFVIQPAGGHGPFYANGSVYYIQQTGFFPIFRLRARKTQDGVSWSNAGTSNNQETGNFQFNSLSFSEYRSGATHVVYCLTVYGVAPGSGPYVWDLWEYDLNTETFTFLATLTDIDPLAICGSTTAVVGADSVNGDAHILYLSDTTQTLYHAQYSRTTGISLVVVTLQGGAIGHVLRVDNVFVYNGSYWYIWADYTPDDPFTNTCNFTLSPGTLLPLPPNVTTPPHFEFQYSSRPLLVAGVWHFTSLSSTGTLILHSLTTAGVYTVADSGEIMAISRTASESTYGCNSICFLLDGNLTVMWRGFFNPAGTSIQQYPDYFYAGVTGNAITGSVETFTLNYIAPGSGTLTNANFMQVMPFQVVIPSTSFRAGDVSIVVKDASPSTLGLAAPTFPGRYIDLVVSCPVDGGTATIGVPYNSGASVVGGGVGPFTFSLAGGGIPPGMTLNPDTGEVEGTTYVVGVYNYTLQVTDSSDPAEIAVVESPCPILVSGSGGPCDSPVAHPETDIQVRLEKVIATMKPATHLPVRGSVT